MLSEDVSGLLSPCLSACCWCSDVPHGAGSGAEGGGVPAQEEGEDDISGTQFVCETVIRSMTLEEAPDHAPLRGSRPATGDSGHMSFLCFMYVLRLSCSCTFKVNMDVNKSDFLHTK